MKTEDWTSLLAIAAVAYLAYERFGKKPPKPPAPTSGGVQPFQLDSEFGVTDSGASWDDHATAGWSLQKVIDWTF
jgi:hypothetical protein